MRFLPIVWQRLFDSRGQTCDRCSATYEGLHQAVAMLKDVLRPLGLEPTLEIREIDEESFKANPSYSNAVWIAGRPIEEWLGARVGSSRCCSVCGDSNCRTLEVGGSVFEAIPERLMVRAALIAAAHLIGPTAESPLTQGGQECCVDTHKIDKR